MKALSLAAILLTSLAAIPSATPEPAPLPAPPADWVEVARHEFDEARVRRPEGQGAMGASVIGFDIEPYRGSMIVDVLERGAVAVFVGWDVKAKDAKRATADLRVVFHEQKGKTHATRAAASGGQALLFHSPDGLPIAKLTHFTLERKSKAAWAKKR